MISVSSHNLNYFIGQLREDLPYSFNRFGNGEWDCIFELQQRTNSGSQDLRSRRLRDGLMSAVQYENVRYFKGLQSPGYLDKLSLLSKIETWIPQSTWYPADVFHRASEDGRLFPLVEQLRIKKVVVIGPKHLKGLDQLINVTNFIEVKSVDCYSTFSQIFTDLTFLLPIEPGTVFSFSAGPAAKILIKRLFTLVGETAFLLDLGSLWDVYCGIKSRKYHFKMTSEIICQNLEGFS